MHLLFALMFGLSLQFEPEIAQASLAEPIQAVFIDQPAIDREKERKMEQQRKREEEARHQAEKKKAEQLEAKRQADLKKRQEVERNRKREEQNKKEAEAKRAAEEKRQAKVKRETEEREMKAAEAKRQAEEKKKREAEATRQRNEQAAHTALGALVNEIEDKVRRNWTYAGEATGLEMIISVKVTRDGEVTSVNVVLGSGDPIFDRSAENAVLKASPLPFPDNPRYYEFIKQFNFIFTPEG